MNKSHGKRNKKKKERQFHFTHHLSSNEESGYLDIGCLSTETTFLLFEFGFCNNKRKRKIRISFPQYDHPIRHARETFFFIR